MTNRQRIERALKDIGQVQRSRGLTPAPCELLTAAILALRDVEHYPLDKQERDALRKKVGLLK